MKHPFSLRQGLLALALALAPIFTATPEARLTLASKDDCEAPVERWQSLKAVRQLAVEKGWQIDRIKIDDGCYEIRGTNDQGRSFKAKLDPETLNVLKMKERDRPRAQKQDRDD